jgi:hypothetical protein
MNEQDLRERMQTSVATEFDAEVIDPAADVARGRRGLRRRRTVGGLATAASVAAVVALGAQYLPVSSAEPDVTQPAAAQTAIPEQARAVVAISLPSLDHATNLQLKNAKKFAADPRAVHVRILAGTAGAVGELSTTTSWKQSGGTGLLYVSITNPGAALAKEKWCGPAYTPDLIRMTCTNRKAPNGKQVVVGTVDTIRDSKGVPYHESGGLFVRYVQPDGQVVIAAVLGMNTLKRVADGLPKGVKNPAVTWQELAALATDPELRLK